jgi:hypothetical protein
VHPHNRICFGLATATLVVYVETRRIPMVPGGDRFPAWLAIKSLEVLGDEVD